MAALLHSLIPFVCVISVIKFQRAVVAHHWTLIFLNFDLIGLHRVIKHSFEVFGLPFHAFSEHLLLLLRQVHLESCCKVAVGNVLRLLGWTLNASCLLGSLAFVRVSVVSVASRGRPPTALAAGRLLLEGVAFVLIASKCFWRSYALFDLRKTSRIAILQRVAFHALGFLGLIQFLRPSRRVELAWQYLNDFVSYLRFVLLIDQVAKVSVELVRFAWRNFT